MPSIARTLVAVVFAGPLLAQAPPSWTREEAIARLGAADARDVAWAAHFAGENTLREAIPGLRAALRKAPSFADSELVRLHVLDALLRLDAEVPGDELLPHAVGGLRVPALLLAARHAEANRRYFEQRMDALAGAEDLEWRVCGNLLAAQPPPAFAAHCLAQLRFVFCVRVDDREPMRRGCGHCLVAPVAAVSAAGFPPPVRYVLDADNATCRTPSGFACIAWRREPGLPGEIAGCDVQRAWCDWLASLGGKHTAAACAETRKQITHFWTGLGKLREVVRTEQRSREQLFRAMIVELVRAGELSSDQAALVRHAFDVELVDVRGKPTKPLPAVEDLLLPAIPR